MRADRYPRSIRDLVRALVRDAIRLRFHGRARVDTDGPFFVITLRVRQADPLGGDVLAEMTERERKRRARLERG